MIGIAPPAFAGTSLQLHDRKAQHLSAPPDPTRYRLTTAKIVYRLPDEPERLQIFVWQKFDVAPDFPELSKFLDFWRKNIEGELHSVRVGQGNGRPRRFPHIVPGSGTRH
jgi:uncharacterized protein Usg